MKKKILITRTIFQEVVDDLSIDFDIEMGGDDPYDKDDLRRRAVDKHALMVWSDRIDDELLAAAPNLKAICNIMVGYNNIDVSACTKRGIVATNTPGVLDDTTADMAWALLLAAARRLPESERWLREGNWDGLRFRAFLGRDIHNATLGILGMGRIGQAVARRAKGFNMSVIYHNRKRLDPQVETDCCARYVDFEGLLGHSDFLSINLPYSAASHHLIGAQQLASMKSSAIIINTARGGIVDDNALIHALKTGEIAGAGLDVFEDEPRFNKAFLSLPNVALAPHIGSATYSTRLAMARLAARNVQVALNGGRPPNLINPEVWENVARTG